MKKIRIGISGLGRLGMIHAQNLASKILHCELVAACDKDIEKLQWAHDVLGVEQIFTDYQQMLALDVLDGVFSVSPTALHGQQIIAALEAGKHVFCEKPLAITLKECVSVEKERAKYPNQICMIGFMRRYDPAYMRAKKKIERGDIGKPFFIRSSSGDMNETAEFQIEFAPKSGGIFIDMGIHDVDTIHWLTNTKMKRVYGVGGAYCHAGFAECNDADNAVILAEQEDGSIAMLKVTRNDFYGDSTDVCIQGTKGMLHVSNRSRKDQLDEYVDGVVRTECTNHFTQRFAEAFVNEAQSFVDHIASNTHPEVTLADATYATKAAIVCREALQHKKIIDLKDIID